MSALSLSPRVYRRGHAGFSIVELMVVTLISLIVFGLGLTIVNAITRARNQTTARVRASENARLFFQLLEKDLAASNPGPHDMVRDRLPAPPSAAYPLTVSTPGQSTVLEEDLGGVVVDILQFYTRSDTATVTDEYVFVRYFVNRANNTLCRQVIPVADTNPANAPELMDDPLLHTNTIAPAALQFALFDEVKSLFVVHRVWDQTEKALKPTSIPEYQEVTRPVDQALITNATHLRVMLVLRYTIDGGTTYLERTFSKVLPAPWQNGG